MSAGAQPQRRAADALLLELRERVNETEDRSAEHEARLDMLWKSNELVTVQIQELSGKVDRLEQAVPAMVTKGLRDFAADPDSWLAVREGMRKSAEKAAGGWLLSSVRWAFGKAFAGIVVLVLVYNFGGLPALLDLLKLKAAP